MNYIRVFNGVFQYDNVTYFGMDRNSFSVTKNESAYDDGVYCPNCKESLEYSYYHYNHIGDFECTNCGHKRNKPEYAVTDLNLNNSEMIINNKHKISMNLRSVYTAYNMLATFAVTKLVGLSDDKIVESLK